MKRGRHGKKRHRYAPESAYTRGAATRARLVDAARILFARRGFEGASTREIAAAAGLNAPALQYYFNNKEGVYAACAADVASRAWTGLRDVVGHAENLLGRPAGDAELIEAFCAIQVKLADYLVDAADDWLLWLARERISSVADRASGPIERQNRRLMRVRTAVIARLLGRGPRDRECRIREMSLTGEVVYFHFMRASALRTLGWRAIDAGRLALLKRILREHSVAALQALPLLRAAATAGPPAARITEDRRVAALRRSRRR